MVEWSDVGEMELVAGDIAAEQEFYEEERQRELEAEAASLLGAGDVAVHDRPIGLAAEDRRAGLRLAAVPGEALGRAELHGPAVEPLPELELVQAQSPHLNVVPRRAQLPVEVAAPPRHGPVGRHAAGEQQEGRERNAHPLQPTPGDGEAKETPTHLEAIMAICFFRLAELHLRAAIAILRRPA